jgi:hypothetical protein
MGRLAADGQVGKGGRCGFLFQCPQPIMTKNAKFLIAALLIASALFTLRFCYPHSRPQSALWERTAGDADRE